MIDSEKIIPIIKGYKEYFPVHWKDEKYKWEAVKHFQENWDIDAENFGEMFKKATEKTSNLLGSGYAYPRGMILEFAKADDNAVREMFRRLYDESLDISDRVTAFMDTAEELRNKYNDGTWKQHYQNTNYISTYLWLMYPEKYYIYKYELYKAVADELDDSYQPKRNGSVETMVGGFRMYDEIRDILQEDDELRQMLNDALTDDCFIIDEINRGNLSKIFGELLMLIETDKRGEKHKLNLVYGGTAFYIPENLHIIGMMNTADRSLAMIDYALRRRFSFYTMHPAFDNAADNGFEDYTKKISCELYHTIISKIIELNNTIRKDTTLGKGFEIGHSYFAPEDVSVIDDEWVRNVVEYEIIPLIEEYWFDNDKMLGEWTKTLYHAIGEEK